MEAGGSPSPAPDSPDWQRPGNLRPAKEIDGDDGNERPPFIDVFPIRTSIYRVIEDFHGFSIEDQNRFEDISQWIGSLTLSTNSVSASEFLSLDSREWMELIQKWNCEQEFPFFWFSTFFSNYLKVRKGWFIPYPDATWTYHRAAWLAQTSLIISVNSDPVTLNYLI